MKGFEQKDAKVAEVLLKTSSLRSLRSSVGNGNGNHAAGWCTAFLSTERRYNGLCRGRQASHPVAADVPIRATVIVADIVHRIERGSVHDNGDPDLEESRDGIRVSCDLPSSFVSPTVR